VCCRWKRLIFRGIECLDNEVPLRFDRAEFQPSIEMKLKKLFAAVLMMLQLTAVNAANNDLNPISVALQKDDAASLAILLDKFYKKNKPLKKNKNITENLENAEILILALLLQKPAVTAMLLNRPVDLNSSVVIDSCDRRRELMPKDFYDFCGSSSKLIRDLADVSLTPLQATCATGDLATMKIIINAGARVLTLTEDEGPLLACLASQKFTLVDFLIDQGANVQAEKYRASPLMTLSSVSVNESDQAIVEMLAEKMIIKGADPHYAAKGRFSELHAASRAGNLAVVKLLVRLGADINFKSDSGFTPLGYAEKSNKQTVVDFLKSKNAQK
jgi:Ankyrin repeats (3 copies)